MPAAALAVAGALLGGGALGAVVVEQVVFATAETAVGSAPSGPGGQRETAWVTELQPGATLGFRGRRSSLELTLSPRFYYRRPNLADLERPLVLVQAGVLHNHQLDPRLRWTSRAGLRYGEVEYSSARVVLGSPVSRPTEDPVVSSMEVGGETGFAWRVTRRYELSLAGVASHAKPLGREDEGLYPATTTTGAIGGQRYRLDARSQLLAPTTFHYYAVSTSPDWFAVSQSFGYQRALARRTSLETTAGATAAWQAGEPVQAYPRGTVAVEQVVHETRRVRLLNRIAAVAEATFDPLLGRLYPVVGLEASLSSAFGGNWSAVIAAYAYTPVTENPVTPDGDDTVLGLSASVGHQVSDHVTLDFGARQSTRASHLSVEPFVLSDGETWGFVRATLTFGASSSPGGS